MHAPEFAFERVSSNVRSAVKRLGIRYPVAQDNDFQTWRAYDNDYWPAKYLIDKTGRVRYTHFGEGAYGETESWIRRLLGEKAKTRRTSVQDRTPGDITTPESYLGYARLDRYDGPVIFDREAPYRLPRRTLAQDELAYAGRWTLTPEHAIAGEDARLRLRFQANDIFLVLAGDGKVEVLVDGRPVKSVAVSGLPRLYTLARFPNAQARTARAPLLAGRRGLRVHVRVVAWGEPSFPPTLLALHPATSWPRSAPPGYFALWRFT